MWGAPEDQPDHATLACRTALAMFAMPAALERTLAADPGRAAQPRHRRQQRHRPGRQRRLVDQVQVRRPRQHRQPGQPGAGSDQAPQGPPADHRGDAGLPGCSLRTRAGCARCAWSTSPSPSRCSNWSSRTIESWLGLKRGYEEALAAFHKAEFRQACNILGRLILDHPHDGPALLLLSRAVGCLVEEPEPFDPVMVLQGK